MKLRVGPVLLLSCWMLHLASGLNCYSCTDSSGTCNTTRECVGEDSCLTLKVDPKEGQQIFRQCLKYSDCGYLTLSKRFRELSGFTFNCCQNNLCNSGSAVTTATPILTAVGLLLSVCWCWI